MTKTITIISGDEYLSFEVGYGETTTVLDALETIRHAEVPDLKYRHSCHHGSCGTCGAVINGKEALMCLSRISDYIDAVITVEPLERFVLVGDVAVHPGRLFESMIPEASYLARSERSQTTPLPPDTEMRVRFEACIECGLCVNACPVENDFLGPQALAQISREIANRPGRKGAMLEIARGERGVIMCERHVACSRVCPTGVMPARHIQLLKNELGDSLKR